MEAGRVTLSQAMLAARRRLAGAGIDTPDLDARILAAHALGLDRTAAIAEGRRVLTAGEAARIDALIGRRLAGEPVGRILGRREFWGLDFVLGPDTLEPRPDSETVVQAMLDFIDAGPGRAAPLRIADLGTGSGCLMVALLRELPAAFGIGIDRSAGAAAVARSNAAANGVGARAGFAAGDWTGPLAEGGLDAIVANPPYIPTKECFSLAREVAGYDPLAALDGGPDGLNAYRAIFGDVARVLKPGGGLVLELGIDQHEAVAALAAERGLRPGPARRDLNGIERALLVTVPGDIGPARQKTLGMPGRTG